MSNLKAANLQKIRNGKKTYAITPGLPAGFITPAQLRVFAEVAEKFHLVMKLTSAQRIMLTGLKEEDIDAVWKDLGMDPAFSTPTCVRSVKICPGDTFCKRGRQDSVKLGMIIDKRYQGVEMPRKMKMGVSGCPNSCSESLVRDIGVVGHNDGWWVYVGGNAGGNPRIATLLAKDLNMDETLRLIDIVIAFYKKYAQLERLGDLIDRLTFPVFQATILTEFTGKAFVPEVLPNIPASSAQLPVSEAKKESTEKKVTLPLTEESIVGAIIAEYPHTIPIFQSFGMGCMGCNAAGNEPLKKASEVHGMDLAPLLEALNHSFHQS